MYLIAEIGLNANGSLQTAIEMILKAKECGANAVKFQKRTVSTVYTKEFLDSPRDSPWGLTQRAQKNGLEFKTADHIEIVKTCRALNLDWSSSAFDVDSLNFVEGFDPSFHKVASAMITNLAFLSEVAKLNRRTIISTGMCEMKDIATAITIFESFQTPVILMHCVGLYPCPDELCNISMVKGLSDIFGHRVFAIGYSGHERGIQPTLAAVALGAKYIERHFTLDRTAYGSDQAASLEPAGLKRIREYGEQIELALGRGDKVFLPKEMEVAKKLRWWE